MEPDIRLVVSTAIFTAVVFVFTVIVAISIPATRGFWNVGEAGVYIAALIGGPIVGAIAGGVGSALADIVLGYAIYAPGTLVIKGCEGLITGYLYQTLTQRDEGRKGVVLSLCMLLGILALLIFSLAYFGLTQSSVTVELSSEPLHVSVVFEISPAVILITAIAVGIVALVLLLLGKETPIMVFSCLVGGIVMVLGYFAYEAAIMGGAVALVEVLPNFMQVIIGIIIAIPVVRRLREMGLEAESRRPVG